MKLLLAPVLTLVLSVGLRPVDLWPVNTGAEALEQPAVVAIQGHPDWEVIDEFVGIKYEISFPVVVTGYSSTRDQCDNDPFITASNKQVRPGIIALSRDLLQRYNPDAPFTWGDRVYLKGFGEFTVEDCMNSRYTRRADIWFSDRRSAAEWGVKKLDLVAIPTTLLIN
ncbi:MAG: hypothetical protein GY835_04360 [bacterium]|nr:hypothetical protein [bacterium]